MRLASIVDISATSASELAGGTSTVSGRISIPEIAERLSIGRLAVYEMLQKGIIPGIRLGRRWIITRFAYLEWEKSCGRSGTFSGRN